MILSELGREMRRGKVELCLHIVVPAQAGTHNHRIALLRESRRPASFKGIAAAYGSRRSPGRHQRFIEDGRVIYREDALGAFAGHDETD